MLVFFGLLVVVGSVFGGYVLSGGHLFALFQPLELLMIGGAAVGSFIISNDMRVIKATLRAIGTALKPSRYKKEFNVQLLLLFFELITRIRKEGILSLEADIQNYKESEFFSKYKITQNDPKVMEFICDHLQIISTGRVNIHQLETIIDNDIESYEHESEIPAAAINKVADSLPAFGIVAAVMGVVHTMESISKPPAILGALVAKALVGTFLGVLLGYGFIGPLAAAVEVKRNSILKILQAIKILLLATASNLAPSIAVELARKVLYSDQRPKNVELEEIIKGIKANKEAQNA